jgi:hypothetical protein
MRMASTTPLTNRSHRPGGGLWITTALLALVLAGCGDLGPQAERQKTLTVAQFVDVIVALREADRQADPDSAAVEYERRRPEILAEHGVTEEQLREFVDRNQARIDRMAAVWDTISRRLRVGDVDEEPPADFFPYGW